MVPGANGSADAFRAVAEYLAAQYTVVTYGELLVAEAQLPRHGLGWRVLARVHGYDRLARMVPDLQPLAAQAGLGHIRTGEAPPWLRYVLWAA
jgi:hypothetical protein